nr:hypothetical protein [Micromonospora sp. DSM 115978]
MLTVGALVGTCLLGFLAGLFAFRVKSRWCPECGSLTFPRPERRP